MQLLDILKTFKKGEKVTFDVTDHGGLSIEIFKDDEHGRHFHACLGYSRDALDKPEADLDVARFMSQHLDSLREYVGGLKPPRKARVPKSHVSAK